MKKAALITLFILALGLMNPVSYAYAKNSSALPASATPSAVVQNFYGQLLDTMKQGDSLGFAGREKKLAPAINATFDMPAMTRFAVGPTWSQATPDEQKQLISAFTDFSVANYAARFTAFNGEQFNVVDEKPTSSGVIVETTLQPKDADPISLNYLMRKNDKGAWRIVDVFLNGTISELATRRAEFGSIVQRDGVPALVNSLSDKAKQMGPS